MLSVLSSGRRNLPWSKRRHLAARVSPELVGTSSDGATCFGRRAPDLLCQSRPVRNLQPAGFGELLEVLLQRHQIGLQVRAATGCNRSSGRCAA